MCYACLGEKQGTIDVLKSACAQIMSAGGLPSAGALAGSSLGSLSTGLPSIFASGAADSTASPAPAAAASNSNAGRKLPSAVGALTACVLSVVLL